MLGVRPQVPSRFGFITSEGAKAFDDLSKLITEETGAVELQEALKTGKLYLKGDYKVITVHVLPFDLSCTRTHEKNCSSLSRKVNQREKRGII